MEKSRWTVVFRFFSRDISFSPSAMISARLLEATQSHAESLHSFALLPTRFRSYEGSSEKKELWHWSRVMLWYLAGLEQAVTKEA